MGDSVSCHCEPVMSNVSTQRSSRKGPLVVALAVTLLGLLIPVGFYAYGWWRAHRQGEGHWVAVEKGRAFLKQGRPDLAFAAVQHIRDDGPGAGEALTIAGLSLMQFNQPKYARMTLERGLQLQPNQLDATKALANLSLRYGNGLRGVQLLQKASELDPRDIEVWRILGRVYHDVGESAKAAEAFEHVLQLDPKDKESRLLLIEELHETNQTDRATPYVEKLLKEDPNDPQVLALAAQHAYDSGRGPEAKKLADRALERDPNSVVASMVRAKVERSEGHLKEASEDLERAVQINPNDLGALQMLAEVQNALNMPERAAQTMARRKKIQERETFLQQLTELIAAKPDDPEPRYQMGRVAAEGGQLVLAERCFRAALELDPYYKPAMLGLAALQKSAPEGTAPPSPSQPAQEPVAPPIQPQAAAP
jgi:predicted Zn-dependent protease